ncbi:MAG: LacI family transcriptional regulator [Alicyclobacillus herbarius]|uniref:LacI family DNA-binding transcriptional regulator n=1 Tax=Alicyclobacillus herbarius TaxID=122960 RepID=UPI0023570418|nr:LacI family DNA-binding transcriptional regulator [Alicyclobacillus herbarius]MCL6633068.1 LacI family transcriptional regulator [Alicyclobacillus herbarius]
MTTIYDIAKRAGVSAATVSKVLNGYRDVSLETRLKVRRITEELGYRPSAVARSLATKRTMCIGVFFEDYVNVGLRHPFFNDLISAFRDVVGRQGYDVLFFADRQLDEVLSGFEARARHREVDGVLVFGVPRMDPRLLELANSQIPCVFIDLDLVGSRASYLTSDNIGGAMAAVRYLVECGHREIAFFGDELASKPGQDRLIGYQQELRRRNLPFRPEWILKGDFMEESGYRAACRLLECAERPTALFCASDLMAIGAIRAFREHGLEVGKDISVIGFDDITLARYVTPGLTTIRQAREEMGRKAAEELLGLIGEPGKLPSIITVPTELVVRETVGSPRSVERRPVQN